MLRFYVYEPIIQGYLVASQAPQTRAAAEQPSNSCSGRGASALKHRKKPSPLSGSVAPAAGDGQAAAPPSAEVALAERSAGSVPRWRRQVAAAATFVVSGLEHELFLWYLLRTWGLQWFCFFALQVSQPSSAVRHMTQTRAATVTCSNCFATGTPCHCSFVFSPPTVCFQSLYRLLRAPLLRCVVLCCVVQGALLALEGKVKRNCRAAGLQLHPFVSHLAVLLALGVTADTLFWPPLMQPGLVQPLTAAMPAPLARWLGVSIPSLSP